MVESTPRTASPPPGAKPRKKRRPPAPSRISDTEIERRPERTRFWVVAAAGLIVLLGLLAFDAAWVWSYASAAERSISTFRQLVFANGEVIDELAELQADKASLERAQLAVGRASDDVAVVEAGHAYVALLAQAVEQHTHAPYDRNQSEIVAKVSRLQNAMLRVDQDLASWRDAATTMPGELPVELRLAPEPPAIPAPDAAPDAPTEGR
jgi:hypothetical protein